MILLWLFSMGFAFWLGVLWESAAGEEEKPRSAMGLRPDELCPQCGGPTPCDMVGCVNEDGPQ